MSIFLQPPWLPYLKPFLPVSAQIFAVFTIGLTRYNVLDNLSFDLKSLAKKCYSSFSENNVFDVR